MILRSLIAAAGAMCVATSVSAEPLFNIFDAACLKSDGAVDKALGAAQAKGWEPMGKEQAAAIGRQFGETRGEFRGRLNSADRRSLVIGDTGTAAAEADGFRIRFCVVTGPPAEGETVRTEAAAFAAVPADTHGTKADGLYFAYTDAAGKHTQIADPTKDEVIRPLFRSGKARILIVSDLPNATMLAFALPVKSTH